MEWLEDVDQLHGEGSLRDSEGHTVRAPYSILIRRKMRSAPVLQNPPVVHAGRFEIAGVLQRDLADGFVQLQDPKLALTLEDDRTVEIIATEIRSPYDPVPFAISKYSELLIAPYLP